MKKPILLIGLLLLAIAECAQLSAHPNKELEIFSAEVVERITIDAGFGWGIFGGSVYNGNSDYTITQITVKLTPSQIIGTSSASPLIAEQYHIDITVPPLTKAALSMPLDADGTLEFLWELVQVQGYRVSVKSN